jgi:hypothetical protein
MRIGRAQYSRFGSTMHARGVSSVWESAGFAKRRSSFRSLCFNGPGNRTLLLQAMTAIRRRGTAVENAQAGGRPAARGDALFRQHRAGGKAGPPR